MASTTVLADLFSPGDPPALLVLRLLGAVTLVWLAAAGLTAILRPHRPLSRPTALALSGAAAAVLAVLPILSPIGVPTSRAADTPPAAIRPAAGEKILKGRVVD